MSQTSLGEAQYAVVDDDNDNTEQDYLLLVVEKLKDRRCLRSTREMIWDHTSTDLRDMLFSKDGRRRIGRLLSCLVERKSFRCVCKLAPSQASDYDVLKQALLRRYALTEKGYKQKFYEKGESPQQFIVRLEDYFLRWVELSKVDKTFECIKELLVKERYLATCDKILELFLREKAVTSLEELGKIAEQYEDAHGGRDGSQKKGSIVHSVSRQKLRNMGVSQVEVRNLISQGALPVTSLVTRLKTVSRERK